MSIKTTIVLNAPDKRLQLSTGDNFVRFADGAD